MGSYTVTYPIFLTRDQIIFLDLVIRQNIETGEEMLADLSYTHIPVQRETVTRQIEKFKDLRKALGEIP